MTYRFVLQRIFKETWNTLEHFAHTFKSNSGPAKSWQVRRILLSDSFWYLNNLPTRVSSCIKVVGIRIFDGWEILAFKKQLVELIQSAD